MSETTPHRSPKIVAAELDELHASSSKAFVPVNVVKAIELQRELNAGIVATLDAAGLLPDDAAPSSTEG
ncbi:hypothetical protein [Methylibium sp. Root1272]|uniref:hypothetical protein n=1 Tax=Methylibium sp. Root1272 TaxID=1736441 RepID=UPI0006F3D379|nr:hypothetical protein [Methylibium sp. Root1272]KQW76595.1 hypothetical protein ASC67_02785 [Methylibium sp. Root1272]